MMRCVQFGRNSNKDGIEDCLYSNIIIPRKQMVCNVYVISEIFIKIDENNFSFIFHPRPAQNEKQQS